MNANPRRMRPRVAGGLLALIVVLSGAPGFAVPEADALALLAVAVPDSYSTPFETRLRVDEPGVLDNDVSVGDGRPEVTNDVNHGNLNLRNDGSFDYTPDDGFSGTDSFVYELTRVTVGIPDHATVTINVGAAPTPKPTPTPSPTPAPTPAPTPTPSPTPAPTPTPTPRPSTILPLPTLPPLPLPTLPDLLPTPTPTLTPESQATPKPTASPTPTSAPTASPSVLLGAGPVAPGPGTGGSTGAGPGIGADTGGGGASSDGGPGSQQIPTDLAIVVEPEGIPMDLAVALDGGGISVEWLVPTVAVTVPGLLLMLAVLAQSLGAMAWLPFVRRGLGDFGVRRRRSQEPRARA